MDLLLLPSCRVPIARAAGVASCANRSGSRAAGRNGRTCRIARARRAAHQPKRSLTATGAQQHPRMNRRRLPESVGGTATRRDATAHCLVGFLLRSRCAGTGRSAAAAGLLSGRSIGRSMAHGFHGPIGAQRRQATNRDRHNRAITDAHRVSGRPIDGSMPGVSVEPAAKVSTLCCRDH